MHYDQIKNLSIHLDLIFKDLADCALVNDLVGAEDVIQRAHEFAHECTVRGRYAVVEMMQSKVNDLLPTIETADFAQLLTESFPIPLRRAYDMVRLYESTEFKAALIRNLIVNQAVAFDATDASSSAIALAKLLAKEGDGKPLVMLLGEILKFNANAIAGLVLHCLRVNSLTVTSHIHTWIAQETQIIPLMIERNQYVAPHYRELIDMRAAGIDVNFTDFPFSRPQAIDLIYQDHKLQKSISISMGELHNGHEYPLDARASYCMVRNFHSGILMGLAEKPKMDKYWMPIIDAVIEGVEAGYIQEDSGLRKRLGMFLDAFLGKYSEARAIQAVKRYPRDWLIESSIYRTTALESDLGL
jgi:hypothetical protein